MVHRKTITSLLTVAMVVITISGSFVGGVAAADGPPSPPHSVYGYVTDVDGNAAADVTVEFVYDGSVVNTTQTDSDGNYDTNIPDPDADASGEEVTVRVKNSEASDTFTWSSGGSTQIDLQLGSALPHKIHGVVTNQNDDPVSGETVEVVYDGSAVNTTTTADDGSYSVLVEDPDSETTGESLTVQVAGYDATETVTWESDGDTEVNLAISESGIDDGIDTVNIDSPTATNPVSVETDGTLDVTYDAEDANFDSATLALEDGGTAVATIDVAAGSDQVESIDLSASGEDVAEGTYDLTLNVTDTKGNSEEVAEAGAVEVIASGADDSIDTAAISSPTEASPFTVGPTELVDVTYDAQDGAFDAATVSLVSDDGTTVASSDASAGLGQQVRFDMSAEGDDVAAGTYDVVLEVSDTNGNSETVTEADALTVEEADEEETTTEAPDDDDTASGGGGGGGQTGGGGGPIGAKGVTTGVSGTQATITISGGMPVESVGFVSEADLDASVSVKELGAASHDPPAGKTFVTGADITFNSGNEDDVTHVQIGIEQDRLDELGVEPSQLTVNHYESQFAEWEELETTVVSTDGGVVVVEAPSVGFSEYVVFAQEDTETTTTEPTTQEPTTEEPTTEEPTTDQPTTEQPTTEKPTTTETPDEGGPGPLLIGGIVVVVLALLAALYLAFGRE